MIKDIEEAEIVLPLKRALGFGQEKLIQYLTLFNIEFSSEERRGRCFLYLYIFNFTIIRKTNKLVIYLDL